MMLLTMMRMMLLAGGEIEIMEAISSDRMPWASSQPCNGWHAHGDDDDNDGDDGDDGNDIDSKWRQTKSSWLADFASPLDFLYFG